jgi:hypothetical protein
MGKHTANMRGLLHSLEHLSNTLIRDWSRLAERQGVRTSARGYSHMRTVTLGLAALACTVALMATIGTSATAEPRG